MYIVLSWQLISSQHPEKDIEKGEESWDALYCKGQVDSVSQQCQEAATVVGGWKEEEKERQVCVRKRTRRLDLT